MKKGKILLSALAVAMSFAVASCDGGAPAEDTGSDPASTSSVSTSQVQSQTTQQKEVNTYVEKLKDLASVGVKMKVQYISEPLEMNDTEVIAINSSSLYYESSYSKYYYKDKGNGKLDYYSKSFVDDEWEETKDATYPESRGNLMGYAEYYLSESADVGTFLKFVSDYMKQAQKDGTIKYIDRDCDIYKTQYNGQDLLIYIDQQTGAPLYGKYYVNSQSFGLVGWTEYKVLQFTTPYTLDNPVDKIKTDTPVETEKFGADSIYSNIPTNLQIKYYESNHNTSYVFQKLGNNMYRWNQIQSEGFNADAFCYKYNEATKTWSIYQRNYDPTDDWRESAIGSKNKFKACTFDEEIFFDITASSFKNATKTTETAVIAGVTCEKYVQTSMLYGVADFYYSPEYQMIFKKVINPGESDEYVYEIKEITKNVTALADFVDSPATANPFGATEPIHGGDDNPTESSTEPTESSTEPTESSTEPTESSTEPTESSTEPTSTTTDTPVEVPINITEWEGAFNNSMNGYILQREIHSGFEMVTKKYTVSKYNDVLVEMTLNNEAVKYYYDSEMNKLFKESNGSWVWIDEDPLTYIEGYSTYEDFMYSYNDFVYNAGKNRFECATGGQSFVFTFKTDKSLDEFYVLGPSDIVLIEDKFLYIGDVSESLPNVKENHMDSYEKSECYLCDDENHAYTCLVCGKEILEKHNYSQSVKIVEDFECGSCSAKKCCLDCGYEYNYVIAGDNCVPTEYYVYEVDPETGEDVPYVYYNCECCNRLIEKSVYTPEKKVLRYDFFKEPLTDLYTEIDEYCRVDAEELSTDGAPVLIYETDKSIFISGIHSKNVEIKILAMNLDDSTPVNCEILIGYIEEDTEITSYVVNGLYDTLYENTIIPTKSDFVENVLVRACKDISDARIEIHEIVITYEYDAFM